MKMRAIWIHGVGGVVLAGLVCWAIRCNRHDTGTYVVTNRDARSIVYRPLNQMDDLHIMVLQDSTVWYPHIRIGDTIRGARDIMDRAVCGAYWINSYPVKRVQTIETVNGRPEPDWARIARRDSVIRAMQIQKVK